MARINKVTINKTKIDALLFDLSKKIEPQVYNQVKANFESAKQQMIDDFDEHPVTQEIEAGPEAENITDTLEPRSDTNSGGNLFSFIGFNASNKPTEVVRKILKNDTRLIRKPQITKTTNTVSYSYVAEMPSKDELAEKTPLPWPGFTERSWLLGIEEGISGLNYYIYSLKLSFSASSRSGTGLQYKKQLSSGLRFKNISYISPVLNAFKSKVRVNI